MARAKRHYIPGQIWTKSVAVGSANFVENIKGLMGTAAIGGKIRNRMDLFSFVNLRFPMAMFLRPKRAK